MMSKEIDDAAEFWLPPDFLTDDFFGADEKPTEDEGDDETLHLMNYLSFHGENKNPKTSVMATSPQSTLCGVGRWSANSTGSPDGNSLVSSPPSTPLQTPRDDALDLLHAAAGQVERLDLNSSAGNTRSIPIKNRHHHQRRHIISNQDLIQQQMQAAYFFQLKRQQLLKIQQQQQQQQQQQLNAVLLRQQQISTPLGLSSSAWPPLQKQAQHPPPLKKQGRQPASQQGSGMTAVFLNGDKRQSAGTGVFLPRCGGSPAETRKNKARTSVVLPARVVQALNLDLEDMEAHPRAPNCYVLDRDVMKDRSNKKKNQAAAAAVGASPELRLPQEWTY